MVPVRPSAVSTRVVRWTRPRNDQPRRRHWSSSVGQERPRSVRSTTRASGGSTAATSVMSRRASVGSGAGASPGREQTQASGSARSRYTSRSASIPNRAPCSVRPWCVSSSASHSVCPRPPSSSRAATACRAADTFSRGVARSRSNRRAMLGTVAAPGTTAATRASPQCFASAMPRLSRASPRRCQTPTPGSTRPSSASHACHTPCGCTVCLPSVLQPQGSAGRAPTPLQNCRVVSVRGGGGAEALLPDGKRGSQGVGVG